MFQAERSCGIGAGSERLKGEMMSAAKFPTRRYESHSDARNSIRDNRRISSLHGK